MGLLSLSEVILYLMGELILTEEILYLMGDDNDWILIELDPAGIELILHILGFIDLCK